MKPQTILITGASSGIGMEMAHVFAREGNNVFLVAREEERLRRVATNIEHQYGVKAWPLHLDLTSPGSVEKIRKAVRAAGLTIDVVINNAGFGEYGELIATDMAREAEMIQLNCIVLTEMTKVYGAEMAKRGSGKILNVASIAAFFPGVHMDVYYATKAYVLSLTLAAAEELRPKGVQVSVLCPGPTKTMFQSHAHAGRSRFFGRAGDARDVAEAAYRGVSRGKLIIIPGWRNKLSIFLSRFVPRRWLAPLVRRAD